MSQQNKRGVLSDHQRVRRKLVPPLLAAMGEHYSPYSWAQELAPEMLWIALLIDCHGPHEGVELARILGQAAADVSKHDPKPMFSKISSFGLLQDAEKVELVKNIGEQNNAKIVAALRPMHDLLDHHALQFLFASATSEHGGEVEELGKLLQELYDRYSKTTTLVMATAFYLGVSQGKIMLPAELAKKLEHDFEHIVNYPDTDESKMAASMFRASAPVFNMQDKSENGDSSDDSDEWLDHFWQKIGRHGECIQSVGIDVDEEIPEDPFWSIVVTFQKSAKLELKDRVAKWGFDLNNVEPYEVLNALLARQTALGIEFASAPQIWTYNSAPLFLRSMADVYIATAWILGDREARAKKFIDDGLGAIKLEIAHREKELELTTDKREKFIQEKTIKQLEGWLSAQRFDAFVEVNLGSWSGMSTRAMAEEADCLDFYNYVYQPFSAAVHSSWAHIGRLNAIPCENPSHRFHKLPVIGEIEGDPYWLYLAAKYLEKTFATFDAEVKIKTTAPSAFQQLCDALFVETDDETES